MDCYFCIVNLPGKMGADVCVLAASNDTDAMKAVAAQASHWIGYETIFLYFGERFVGSLADGHKGFPVGPVSTSARAVRPAGMRRSVHAEGPTKSMIAVRKAG